MEKKENNEFLSKELLEPRALINPQVYEHTALYTALYQTIFGSYTDYGFNDRATLDVYITAKIKTMLTVIDKIIKANPNVSYDKLMNLKESDFEPPAGTLVKPTLSSSDNHVYSEVDAFDKVIENNWIGNYLPLLKSKSGKLDSSAYNKDKDGKPIKNGDKNYVSEFLKGFDRSVAVAQDLTARLGDRKSSGNMMNINDARQLIKAEFDQMRGLFEGYRTASEGMPFKFDKEGNKYKNGAYYEAYRGEGSASALNQRKEKRYFIRKEIGKILLKTVGLAAFGALTVFSGGALLSYGGIAMSSVFGTIFANIGIGSAVSAGLGTLAGGYISSKLVGSIAFSGGALYKRFKDYRDFIRGVGKYAESDDKLPKGFNKRKEQYYTALGLRDYFNKGMRGVPRKARKYVKKYLKANPGLDGHKTYYNYVNEQDGTFQTLYRKLNNVVQAVPEQDDNRKMFAGEATSFVRDRLGKTNFKDLIEATQVLDDYKDKIGNVNTNAFRASMANSYVNAFNDNIFNQPFSSNTIKLKDKLEVPQIKETIEKYSQSGNSKKQIDSSIAFMDAIRIITRPYQSAFKLNGDIGLGIEQQITINADVMNNACQTLCNDLTDIEKTQIDSITTKIQNMTSAGEAATIQAELAAITRGGADAGFDKAKTYLESMLNKRIASSKFDSAQIAATVDSGFATLADTDPVKRKIEEVSHLIEGLKRGSDGEFVSGSKTFSEIKSKIMEDVVGYTDAHKQAALDILDKQVYAIENREFSDTEAALIPVMKLGNFNNLADLMKYIKELSFDKIGSSELNAWYDGNIKNNSRKPFLDNQIKTKIENIVMAEAKNEKYKKKDAATLDEIVKFIQSVKSCVLLDEAQRGRIISSMQKNIEQAVRIKINAAKKGFAMKYDSTEFSNLIDLDSGILRDFFELQTPASKTIRNELVGLSNLSDLKETITANMDGGSPLDEDVKESKAFSLVYMFRGAGVDRTTGDSLYDIIKSIKEKTNNALSSMSNFSVSGRSPLDPPVENQYIVDMKAMISNIMSSLDDYEKYAALIMLKKNCIAAFKSHDTKFRVDIVGSGHSFQNYLADAANKENFMKQVYESWVRNDPMNKGLLNQIDDALNIVKGNLAHMPKIQDEEYYSYSAVQSAQKSYGDKTADEYGRSSSR